MPQRTQQADDPVAAAVRSREAHGVPQALPGDGEALRQITVAVSALAGRVDALSRRVDGGLAPRVAREDRLAALEEAREYVTQVLPDLRSTGARERVEAELAVARYLTGE